MNYGDGHISSFDVIKKNKYIIEHIVWDVEPRQLMEPRYKTEKDKDVKYVKTLAGYLFYIDTMTDKEPALFLMRHTAEGCAETVAKIDGIPDELIAGSIRENKEREFFGMYPINKKLEDWLKKELGIED
jgi:hypothetical protein